MSTSPLKRVHRDPLNEDRGFTYIKRRRLSHGQAVNDASLFRQQKGPEPLVQQQQEQARFRPLSPPSSGKNTTHVKSRSAQYTKEDAHTAPPDKESDEDSGRESQNSNATRGSFSSLINYDPSSQQALASQALNYVNVHPSVPAHTTQTPARYTNSLTNTVRAHAEMLRLRLKVALYKVRTNQINVPFSRLRAPDPPAPVSVPAPIHNAQGHPSVIRTGPSPRHSSPDEPLPTASREQPLLHHDGLPYGMGMPSAPDMTPNAYSNRFMPLQRAPSSSPPFIHIPSSLPRNHITRGTPMMARISHDHDSLDSEATELAEDMHDTNEGMAESPSQFKRPSQSRRSMFAQNLPR